MIRSLVDKVLLLALTTVLLLVWSGALVMALAGQPGASLTMALIGALALVSIALHRPRKHRPRVESAFDLVDRDRARAVLRHELQHALVGIRLSRTDPKIAFGPGGGWCSQEMGQDDYTLRAAVMAAGCIPSDGLKLHDSANVFDDSSWLLRNCTWRAGIEGIPVSQAMDEAMATARRIVIGEKDLLDAATAQLYREPEGGWCQQSEVVLEAEQVMAALGQPASVKEGSIPG